MEPGIYDSADSKTTHRIEMLMLAILVHVWSFSTSQPGLVLSRATTTSSSSSLLTST